MALTRFTIYFRDEDRAKQFRAQKFVTQQQIQESQTFLTYSEIDPPHGLLVPLQFTWIPVSPDRERYSAIIDTRAGEFAERIGIERIHDNWRFNLRLTNNVSGESIFDCCDTDFPGAATSYSPACFPNYTALPGPDLVLSGWVSWPQENRVSSSERPRLP